MVCVKVYFLIESLLVCFKKFWEVCGLFLQKQAAASLLREERIDIKVFLKSESWNCCLLNVCWVPPISVCAQHCGRSKADGCKCVVCWVNPPPVYPRVTRLRLVCSLPSDALAVRHTTQRGNTGTVLQVKVFRDRHTHAYIQFRFTFDISQPLLWNIALWLNITGC